MRRTTRSVIAAAALATTLCMLAPAAPAGAEGDCYDVYVYVTNPPAGATVCEP